MRRRGVLYSRRFYDLKHGGSGKAKAAALGWRDKLLANLNALSMREFHQRKRSNNTSGVPGVHFIKPVRQPHGVWQATLKLPNGRRTSKTFSVLRLGHRKAFKLAVAARRKMLEMVDERPYLYAQTAKRLARPPV